MLLRAHGEDSDVLIDWEMEVTTHQLLSERGLAAPLLARFANGLLYKFLPGHVCTAWDLQREPVWRAVAARLGEWHAKLPLPDPRQLSKQEDGGNDLHRVSEQANSDNDPAKGSRSLTGRFPSSTLWSVLHKWTSALPAEDDVEDLRNAILEKVLESLFEELYIEGQGRDSVSVISL